MRIAQIMCVHGWVCVCVCVIDRFSCDVAAVAVVVLISTPVYTHRKHRKVRRLFR